MLKQFSPDERLENEIDNKIACGLSGFADYQAGTGFGVADQLRTDCGLSPLPLPERKTAPKFPIEALGEVLGEAAKRMAYYVQTPLGMAGQSVLAAASLVAQAHINVARGNIGTSPVSLFCLTVAESGDRKSSIDKLALKPVRDYEAQRYQQAKEDRQKHKADLAAWQLRYDSITKAAASSSGKAAMSAAQEQQLAKELTAHEKTRPQPPENSNITFEEPTAEGVWRHFQQGLPSAGLFSDEGVSFFNGHGMSAEAIGRTIGSLSQLWDGKPLTRTRAAEGESGVMAGRRLAAHLMVQPVVSAQVLANPLLLGQGFLARFLVCHEEGLMGGRFLFDRDVSEAAHNDPAIIRYWGGLNTTLSQPMPRDNETGELQLKTLKVEGDAYAAWTQIHDGIEGQLKAGGAFVDIKAFGAKAAENTARIAAVLAFTEHQSNLNFDDGECVITTDHIQRAGVLIAYYLESMGLRTGEAQYDKEALAAGELLDWIKKRGGQLTADDFKSLPTAFRSAKKARELLEQLADMGHVKVLSYGGKGKPKPNAWEMIAHD